MLLVILPRALSSPWLLLPRRSDGGARELDEAARGGDLADDEVVDPARGTNHTGCLPRSAADGTLASAGTLRGIFLTLGCGLNGGSPQRWGAAQHEI